MVFSKAVVLSVHWNTKIKNEVFLPSQLREPEVQNKQGLLAREFITYDFAIKAEYDFYLFLCIYLQ
jgi:hypothetical protein